MLLTKRWYFMAPWTSLTRTAILSLSPSYLEDCDWAYSKVSYSAWTPPADKMSSQGIKKDLDRKNASLHLRSAEGRDDSVQHLTYAWKMETKLSTNVIPFTLSPQRLHFYCQPQCYGRAYQPVPITMFRLGHSALIYIHVLTFWKEHARKKTTAQDRYKNVFDRIGRALRTFELTLYANDGRLECALFSSETGKAAIESYSRILARVTDRYKIVAVRDNTMESMRIGLIPPTVLNMQLTHMVSERSRMPMLTNEAFL